MAAAAVSRRLAVAVRELSGAWYGRHMAAAERAIRTRLPLVDLVLEVRDARVPASSAFEPLRRRGPLEPDNRRVVVLSKADLANPSETEVIKPQPSSAHWGKVDGWDIKHGESNCTGTVLLVGIPNIGKSAIVNSMHQIGRIGAAEKGKLKQAIVSSHPGETRDITGYKVIQQLMWHVIGCILQGLLIYKVASHPNIYVLDTPGVLSPSFANDDSGPRLALTGAIKGSLLDEYDIAQFLLAVVNSSEEYRKWGNLNQVGDSFSSDNTNTFRSRNQKRQYVSDHNEDFIVKAVRQVLFETISSSKGYLEKEDEFRRLIDRQFVSLREAFKVPTQSSEDICKPVALKLLNLYRTGRLGHYTLDHILDVRQEVVA
ncbi:hypothetical protein HU200_041968 [Digitaria exilis]|uniref:G domain-containing protein n=1 Tax=Digitaria exilis TaxID=1010633 RepID=A0A835B7S5_9POAL|nr:hypothetical protein HU200_041968 [Digitaria exilis]